MSNEVLSIWQHRDHISVYKIDSKLALTTPFTTDCGGITYEPKSEDADDKLYTLRQGETPKDSPNDETSWLPYLPE